MPPMKEGMVKVDRIQFIIDSKNISLGPESARLLRNEICNLLGPRTENGAKEDAPIWIDPNAEPYPEKWMLGHQDGKCVLTIYVK